MLFFTGFSRIASEVAGKKIQNLHARERQLRAMRAMVDEGLAVLQDETGRSTRSGSLLHRAWTMKRELAEGVTTSAIDEIYEAAREAGAIGGKLLGAGGGGFMVVFAEPDRQPAVREALRGLVQVPVPDRGAGQPGGGLRAGRARPGLRRRSGERGCSRKACTRTCAGRRT